MGEVWAETPSYLGRTNLLEAFGSADRGDKVPGEQWLGRGTGRARGVKLPRSKAQPLTLQRKALSSLHRLLELEIAPAQSKQFLSELCPAGMSAPLRAVVPAATMQCPRSPSTERGSPPPGSAL